MDYKHMSNSHKLTATLTNNTHNFHKYNDTQNLSYTWTNPIPIHPKQTLNTNLQTWYSHKSYTCNGTLSLKK